MSGYSEAEVLDLRKSCRMFASIFLFLPIIFPVLAYYFKDLFEPENPIFAGTINGIPIYLIATAVTLVAIFYSVFYWTPEKLSQLASERMVGFTNRRDSESTNENQRKKYFVYSVNLELIVSVFSVNMSALIFGFAFTFIGAIPLQELYIYFCIVFVLQIYSFIKAERVAVKAIGS